MPNMELIQAVTVGAGGAANIEFTSIPQTYTDLCVVLSTRLTSTGGATDTTWLNSINGNTSSFTDRVLRGDASSVSSFVPSETPLYIGQSPTASGTTSTFASHSVYIPNYTSSNQKSISVDSVQENNSPTAYMGFTAGLWAQTSAITSLSFTTNSGNFAQYSTAYLYGVASAGAGAKATGGIITSDANYFYHTFISSGVFTPTQSLTADYLVVAGGASGGNGQGGVGGGGGGAGGYRVFNAQSLTAQAYTVTVGAGGAAQTTGDTNGNAGSNSVFNSSTSTGGGGGGGYSKSGSNGGSGGGAGATSSANAGTGTAGQGNDGGTGSTDTAQPYRGGGGGGASAVGATGTASGNGGAGTASSISGTSVTYAGGGGAGGNQAGGAGGSGGGGAGATGSSVVGTSGTANTGGGGGASCGNANSGAGGSGIVIVRYAR